MRTERVGIEPTSPCIGRVDNGFEDRGDHQAPITLPRRSRGSRAGREYRNPRKRAYRAVHGLNWPQGTADHRPAVATEFGVHFAVARGVGLDYGLAHGSNASAARRDARGLQREGRRLRWPIRGRRAHYRHLLPLYLSGAQAGPAQRGVLCHGGGGAGRRLPGLSALPPAGSRRRRAGVARFVAGRTGARPAAALDGRRPGCRRPSSGGGAALVPAPFRHDLSTATHAPAGWRQRSTTCSRAHLSPTRRSSTATSRSVASTTRFAA